MDVVPEGKAQRVISLRVVKLENSNARFRFYAQPHTIAHVAPPSSRIGGADLKEGCPNGGG